MRVEQQNTGIVDDLKQSIGPRKKDESILNTIGFSEKAVEKSTTSEHAKSINMKDATYIRPETEEKKTLAEEIEQSSSLDATERKNQMAVLSNTTSPEDYAKMQEEGFSLDATTSNTIVTETDKIKAQLAKAGVDISIFGDELDLEQLEAITGSTALAAQIAQALKETDLPYTEENIKDTVEALSLAGMLGKPGDGAIKYMLDNGLEPTIENLYMAEYSGSMNYQMNSGQSIDMEPFMDQVEKIIRESGLTVDDASKAASQRMLENEVPLNAENLRYYVGLSNMEFPIDTETLLQSIATAISEGGSPKDAQLLDGYSLAEQAKNAFRVVAETTEEDLAYLVDNDLEVNVQNLEYAINNRETDAQAENRNDAEETSDTYTQREFELLAARRQLEETRLAMTVEANYTLLKKGIQIDTEPLAKLVEELKATENAYYEKLLTVQGVDASEENVSLFRETTEKMTDLKSVPAYVLGMQGVKKASVGAFHEAGSVLKDTFDKANERYETLMTAPRADLGDSIQKAFRNVDDILTDLGLEISEANQRAVRILGYNQIEITAESVAEMKSADEEVQRAFRNLTPATVTEMIRRGINPLDMNFEDLNDIAEQIAEENGKQDDRGFAEYLWKLEKSEDIDSEERASYIGTYRLIHQVEASDGAAVGALVHLGAEITMRNLMMAVRSERRSGKMDYTVDKSFGEVENSGYTGTSITSQIEASYQNNCVKDVMDTLTPGRLKVVMEQNADWESMTPEQLKEALAEADTNDDQLNYAYAKEQLAQLAQSAKVTEDIYTVLEKYDIPNTMSNIMAMEAMAKNRNGMFRQIFGDSTTDSKEKVGKDDLKSAKDAVLEQFGKAIAAPEELAEAQEQLAKVAENVMKGMIDSDEVTSLDVREMRLLSAQLSISSLLVKDEQYAVPVQTESGVVNVSLKIVRGADQKGIVDVMMETELQGRIAATFQAKEQSIEGFVATDNEETRELLQAQEEALGAALGGEEGANLHYAYVSDLDLNHFSMGMFGIHATEESEQIDKGAETYQVQTARLYHIAESFIQQIRTLL